MLKGLAYILLAKWDDFRTVKWFAYIENLASAKQLSSSLLNI